MTTTPGQAHTPCVALGKQASGGYYTNGVYESRIFNAGSSVSWRRMDWGLIDPLDGTAVPGLVALWHIDGSWSDAVGSFSVIPGNAAYTVHAKTGVGIVGPQAGSFDGSANHIDGFGSLGTIKAVEFWIKNANANDEIMSLSASVSLVIQAGCIEAQGVSSTGVRISVNGTPYSRRLRAGWNHVAVVIEDGVTVDALDVGRMGGNYMEGQLDELAMYNRVLPSGEITAHYGMTPRHIGGRVRVQVRASDDDAAMGAWQGSGGAGTVFFQRPGVGVNNLSGVFGSAYRYFQYRILMDGDRDATPVCSYVDISTTGPSYRDDTLAEFAQGSFLANETVWHGDRIAIREIAGLGPINTRSSEPNLLGLWHFDDASWEAASSVSAANGGAGDAQNGATPVGFAAVGSRCGAFDGVDDYVTLSPMGLGVLDFAISAWFNTQSDTLGGLVSSFSGASAYFSIEMNSDGVGGVSTGRVAFVMDDTGGPTAIVSSRGGLNDGEWHHVAAVRNGTQFILYIDGEPVGADADSGFTSIGSVTPFVGVRGTSPDYFEGLVDEVAIYSGRAVTDGEIGFLSGGGSWSKGDEGVYHSATVDSSRPAIWQTLRWSPNGIYGRSLSAGNGLEALWRFEEAVGATISNNVAVMTANVLGAPTRVTGRLGSGWDFNGSPAAIQVNDYDVLEQNTLAVECWINADAVPAADTPVVEKGNGGSTGYALGIDSSGKPYFEIEGTRVTGYAVIRVGKWIHLCGTYDGASELRLYVDGQGAASDLNALGLAPESGVSSLYIARNTAGTAYFNGQIDEVAVHGRALAAGEALDHYSAGAVRLRFQARSAIPANPTFSGVDFTGPDQTTGTYFTVAEGSDTAPPIIPLGQYFQYRGYFASEDHRVTPQINLGNVFVSSYSGSDPDVRPVQGIGYPFLGELTGFASTWTNEVGNTNLGINVKFLISGDPGVNPANWYRYDGASSNWVPGGGYGDAMSASAIDANIGSLYRQLYDKTGGLFRFLAFLHSPGDRQVNVEDVTLTASEGRITVTTPNGAENGDDSWIAGVPYDITWNWSGTVSSTLEVQYSFTGSTGVWVTITNAAPRGVAGVGSLTWTVPEETLRTNCFIRVNDVSDPTIEDVSDAAFTIRRTFRVKYPNGGERLYMGTTTNIVWESPFAAGVVEIHYAPDGSNYIHELQAAAPNTAGGASNTWSWTMPTPAWPVALAYTNWLSTNARVRVQRAGLHDLTDASDNVFTLAGAVVSRPAGGVLVKRGTNYLVEWTSVGGGAQVAIDLSRDGGPFSNVVASVANADGTNAYLWSVTQDGTDDAKLRIRSLSDPQVMGESYQFSLADLNVTAPDGNEVWLTNTTQTITWASGAAGPDVAIYYSTNSGATWDAITTSVTNSGAYNWAVTNDVSSKARIRVQSLLDASLDDFSADDFSVAGVKVIYPNGDEILDKDVNHWMFHNAAPESWSPGGVTLEVDYDDGRGWIPLTNIAVTATNWSLGAGFQFKPDFPSERVRVRGEINAPQAPFSNVWDISDDDFKVSGVQVSFPSNSAVMNIGSPYTISWWSAGTYTNQAQIYYSNAGTNNYQFIMSAGNSDLSPDAANTLPWTVPPQLTPSTNASIRIVAGTNHTDISPSFTLRGIRITAPTNGNVWAVNTTRVIGWLFAGLHFSATNNVWLSTDGGNTFVYELTNERPLSAYTYIWDSHADYDPTTNAVIRVQVTDSPTPIDIGVTALSDPFTLQGIKVRQPAAGTNWALGSTQDLRFVSAAAGTAQQILYSSDGGASWDPNPISTSSWAFVDGDYATYQWQIEPGREPSTNAVVRVAGSSYTTNSAPFNVAGVKINRPFSLDIWAVGETNLIDWISVGTQGTNLIELVYDDNSTFLITNNYSGAPLLNFTVPGGIITGAVSEVNNVRVRVTDSGGTLGVSEPFKIVAQPQIVMQSPLGGVFWKVGETREIQWLRGGQMDAADFRVYWSQDGMVSTNLIPGTPTFYSNLNMYGLSWSIGDNLGATEILVTNVVNPVLVTTSAVFDVAADFNISFPNGDPGEELFANFRADSPPPSWTTRGSAGRVALYYRYGTNTWAPINTNVLDNGTGVNPIFNFYIWDPVPTIQDTNVWFRVQDASYTNVFDGITPGPYDDSDQAFEVKYYTVFWDVYFVDPDTSATQRMDQLSVSDSSGWSQSALTAVPSTIMHQYPYGVYDTAWYREYFHDQVDFHWVCDSNGQVRTIQMAKSEIEPEYHVMSDFHYDLSNRQFTVHSWLERNGAIMNDPPACRIRIYDAAGTEIETISTNGAPSSGNGVFWQLWDIATTEIAQGLLVGTYGSDDIFFAKVEIDFSGVTYSAGMTFALRMAAGEEQVVAIQGIVAAATSNILMGVTGLQTNLNDFRTVTGVSLSNLTDLATTTTNWLDAVNTNVAGLSLALGTNFTAMASTLSSNMTDLTNVVATIGPTMTNLSAAIAGLTAYADEDLARILSRENTIALGTTNTVLYKTRSGYAAPPPSVTLVRLSDSAQVYSNTMAEIFGGIYEDTFPVNVGWGAGSYRLTCMDPNAADSMVVEMVSGGALSGVPGMITSLSNQLITIETEMTNISQIVGNFDLGGVSNVLGSITNDLSQLSNVVTTISSITNTLGSMNWNDITNIRDNVDTVLTNLSVLSGVNWGQVAQLTNAVTAISDMTNALGTLDWSDVTTMDTKVSTIQQYTEQIGTILTEVQGMGGLDYSMVERIEQYVGSETDAAGSGTLFGQINAIQGEMSNVGSGVLDAAQKASQAKTQAADAASGIGTLKKSIGEGDLARSLSILEDVRRSMLMARKDLDDIPRVVKFASLHEDMMLMAKRIEELADSQAWKSWMEGAGLQEVDEGDASGESLGNLNNNLEIMKAEMKLLQKSIDRTANQPQIEAVLIGVPD